MQFASALDQAPPAPEQISSYLSSVLGTEVSLDTSGNFALSTRGLAVRTSDGRFVAKECSSDRLADVTNQLVPGIDHFVFRTRVETLRRGDLIIVLDDPFSARYVLARERGGQTIFLDPDCGDVTELIPDHVMFPDAFVRAVSLFDIFQDLESRNSDFAGDVN
jgi:hypothetical protein